MTLQLRNGIYYLRDRQGTIDRKLSLDTDSHKEALSYEAIAQTYGLDYVQAMIEAAKKRPVIVAEKVRLAAAVKKFLDLENQVVQNSTKQFFRSRTGAFVAYMKDRLVSSITPVDILDFHDHLIRRKLAPKTINNTFSVVNAFFLFCVERQYIARSPVNMKAVRVRDPEPEMTALSPDEIRTFCDYLQNAPVKYRALFTLLLFTGIRYSEAAGLSRENIHVRDGYILITEKKTTQDPAPTKRLKSKSARRRLKLFAGAIPALTAYLESTPERYPFAGISYAALHKFKTKLEQDTGLHFRIHDLRHTLASMLLGMGYNIKWIQRFLGHKTAAMTLDRYGHLEKDDMNNFDERVEEYIGRTV